MQHGRVRVEVEWLRLLSKEDAFIEVPQLSKPAHTILDNIISSFSVSDSLRIKSIESTTRHDVKAVEYFLKEKLAKEGVPAELRDCIEFLHFAATSEDVNNLAYALNIKTALQSVILPALDRIISHFVSMSKQHAAVPMLSRTHGQPATPTTVGKEMSNFAVRLQRQRSLLASVPILGKFNGAVGNFNAHTVAYPTVNWTDLSRRFVEGVLGLQLNVYTTQIEPHDWIDRKSVV